MVNTPPLLGGGVFTCADHIWHLKSQYRLSKLYLVNQVGWFANYAVYLYNMPALIEMMVHLCARDVETTIAIY